MNRNYNLPPGVTLADIDADDRTPEDLMERAERDADRWYDERIDREARTQEERTMPD